MKQILALGIVLGLAAPALADPYEANIRSKQTDAHEMRDARGPAGPAAPQASTGSRQDGFVAEYRLASPARR